MLRRWPSGPPLTRLPPARGEANGRPGGVGAQVSGPDVGRVSHARPVVWRRAAGGVVASVASARSWGRGRAVGEWSRERKEVTANTRGDFSGLGVARGTVRRIRKPGEALRGPAPALRAHDRPGAPVHHSRLPCVAAPAPTRDDPNPPPPCPNAVSTDEQSRRTQAQHGMCGKGGSYPRQITSMRRAARFSSRGGLKFC